MVFGGRNESDDMVTGLSGSKGTSKDTVFKGIRDSRSKQVFSKRGRIKYGWRRVNLNVEGWEQGVGTRHFELLTGGRAKTSSAFFDSASNTMAESVKVKPTIDARCWR
jgi:hypothetical protein